MRHRTSAAVSACMVIEPFGQGILQDLVQCSWDLSLFTGVGPILVKLSVPENLSSRETLLV